MKGLRWCNSVNGIDLQSGRTYFLTDRTSNDVQSVRFLKTSLTGNEVDLCFLDAGEQQVRISQAELQTFLVSDT